MSDKMVVCKSCGMDIAKSAKACPHCGAKNKKPIFKKWWFWLIIVLLLIGMIGSAGSDEGAEANNDTTQEETQQDVQAEIKEEVSNPVEETESLETVDPETIMDLIKVNAAGNFDYFNIEGDETGFTMYVGMDGLAANVATAKAAGYDETDESWAEAKESLAYMYDSIYELMETCGMKDPSLMVCVVNDANTENYLLVFYNGEVIYDVMAE